MSEAKQVATIENPRNYAASVVEHLRELLQSGTPAQVDPQRTNFYEVDGDDETYYIHVSPVSSNVVLLARWLRQPEDCCLSAR